jgi:Family of unknown function (DUF6600)
MKMKRWMGLLVCLFLIAVVIVPPSSAADEPGMVVGRIYYIEGDLLRYVPAEKDWVAVVRDAPFGTEDTLFSGSRGMAELIVPNGTWIRIGNSTQVQFIALDTDLAEMDVASGVARFYNKSSDTVIKATSPFGYVLAYPGTVFDFYVGDNSVEVVAIKGKVSFVHSATEAKYDVAAGSPSILADQQQVSSGEGTVDPDWNRWNTGRETFWAAKARVKGRSVEYLPPNLRDESYALDENGSWESVPYEGTSRWFWRPRVAVGWSPFTVGRWTDWYGDQTWIPAEPFGYVTHHYGNWVYARNNWYWAPPVMSVRVGLPLLDVGFFWYPGRVSWIHTGTYVGWVPLAPRETYYSYRHWGGPHAVVVNNVNITQININLRNYAYVNRAIVVNQNNFYGVNNYTKVRVTNINPTTIINNYRAAPVVNNMVIKNYTTINQRYNYTTVKVNEKPHNTVINRIQQNETVIQKGKKEKASVVQERVKSIPEGKVNREARIEPPKTTNYIVPANQVNRPKSEIKLQQKEIKGAGKGVLPAAQPALVVVPQYVAPAKPGQAKQVVVPQHVAPAKPELPGQAVVPEHVAPARPGQIGKVVIPEHAMPVKPGQKELPGQVVVPKHVAPAQPGLPATVVIPEHVVPARTSQPVPPGQVLIPQHAAPAKPGQAKQVVVPQHVAPAKPELPGQAVVPEHVAPARPGQIGKVVIPEHATPVKPIQKELPGQVVVPQHKAPAQPGKPATVVIPEHVAPVKSVEKDVGKSKVEKPESPTKEGQPQEKVGPEKSK